VQKSLLQYKTSDISEAKLSRTFCELHNKPIWWWWWCMTPTGKAVIGVDVAPPTVVTARTEAEIWAVRVQTRRAVTTTLRILQTLVDVIRTQLTCKKWSSALISDHYRWPPQVTTTGIDQGCRTLAGEQRFFYTPGVEVCPSALETPPQLINPIIFVVTPQNKQNKYPLNNLFSRTTWASRHQKGKTILDSNEARHDGAAVESAGPYASHLHLAPIRWPCQHLITHFYRPDALPDAQPTVSKHWRPICSDSTVV